MPIDLDAVNWSYVALLSAISFIATVVIHLRIIGALLSALLFAAIFVFATYYPHGVSLPTFKSSNAPTSKPSQ